MILLGKSVLDVSSHGQPILQIVQVGNVVQGLFDYLYRTPALEGMQFLYFLISQLRVLSLQVASTLYYMNQSLEVHLFVSSNYLIQLSDKKKKM